MNDQHEIELDARRANNSRYVTKLVEPQVWNPSRGIQFQARDYSTAWTAHLPITFASSDDSQSLSSGSLSAPQDVVYKSARRRFCSSASQSADCRKLSFDEETNESLSDGPPSQEGNTASPSFVGKGKLGLNNLSSLAALKVRIQPLPRVPKERVPTGVSDALHALETSSTLRSTDPGRGEGSASTIDGIRRLNQYQEHSSTVFTGSENFDVSSVETELQVQQLRAVHATSSTGSNPSSVDQKRGFADGSSRRRRSPASNRPRGDRNTLVIRPPVRKPLALPDLASASSDDLNAEIASLQEQLAQVHLSSEMALDSLGEDEQFEHTNSTKTPALETTSSQLSKSYEEINRLHLHFCQNTSQLIEACRIEREDDSLSQASKNLLTHVFAGWERFNTEVGTELLMLHTSIRSRRRLDSLQTMTQAERILSKLKNTFNLIVDPYIRGLRGLADIVRDLQELLESKSGYSMRPQLRRCLQNMENRLQHYWIEAGVESAFQLSARMAIARVFPDLQATDDLARASMHALLYNCQFGRAQQPTWLTDQKVRKNSGLVDDSRSHVYYSCHGPESTRKLIDEYWKNVYCRKLGQTQACGVDTARSTNVPDPMRISEGSTSGRGYAIPQDLFREALTSSSNTGAAQWHYRLYRDKNGVPPRVHYCTSLENTERVAKLFLTKEVIGFDIEWLSQSSATAGIKSNVSTLQIASEDSIAIIHFAVFPGRDTATDLMTPSLRELLSSDEITKVGVAIKGDCSRIKKFLEVEVRGIFELSHLHTVVKYSLGEQSVLNKKPVALARQVLEHLRLPLAKGPVRCSDWTQPLNQEQIDYAVGDAYAGLQVFYALEDKRLALQPPPPRPAHAELDLPLQLATDPSLRSPPTETGVPRRNEDDESKAVHLLPESNMTGADSLDPVQL